MRLIPSRIAYDSHHTATDSSSDVKLAVWLSRWVCKGIFYISFYVSVVICRGDYLARFPVSCHGNGKAVGLLSQHTAHHGHTRQQSAERRRSRRCGLVVLDRFVYYIA